jgi:hypothetical protein
MEIITSLLQRYFDKAKGETPLSRLSLCIAIFSMGIWCIWYGLTPWYFPLSLVWWVFVLLTGYFMIKIWRKFFIMRGYKFQRVYGYFSIITVNSICRIYVLSQQFFRNAWIYSWIYSFIGPVTSCILLGQAFYTKNKCFSGICLAGVVILQAIPYILHVII